MISRDRLVVLSGPQRPHEIVLQGYALVIGVVYLIGAPAPTSLVALLPTWAIYIWAVGLLASGLMTAGSLVLRIRSRIRAALFTQQAAMLLGGAALIWAAYGVVVFAFGGRGLFSAGFCVAWSVANLLRAWQCQRDIRKLQEHSP